jgi:N-acetylneuraminate synthase
MFEINGRKLGDEYPPLIIAEIGINHGGDLEVAKKMVDSAYRAGAEIIKHQTHIIEDEMSHAAKKVVPGNSNKSIYQIMSESALNETEEYELMHYTKSKGMMFISTPFSRAAADRLNNFDVPAFKIGSGECNNYPLIKHIAKFGKPIILSTGMNNLESVAAAVQILKDSKVPYALLHTTNLYPTPFNLVRLGGMLELKDKFSDAVVGLSDHTINNNACLAAVSLGASIVERHFTDSKDRIGPDIINSMDEFELKELIKSSNEIFQMRGGSKKAAQEEQVTMNFAFASVVSIKEIKKGEYFTEENIWVKRPGTGEIKAANFESILGRKAKNNLTRDQHLKWEDVS